MTSLKKLRREVESGITNERELSLLRASIISLLRGECNSDTRNFIIGLLPYQGRGLGLDDLEEEDGI